MLSFNLAYESWVPCLMANDGSQQELGLEEVLIKSHEIREIQDPSPIVTLVLHRILLAILHRVFGPSSMDVWRGLHDQGRWDATDLKSYFQRCRPMLDLLSEERPFYQDIALRGISSNKKVDPNPLTKLVW